MASNKPKIYEDIEATADYYSPRTYAGGEGGVGSLLSFYQDLEMHPDSLGDTFIPLTTARTRNPQASKVFAIGVLPPAANVTGKILDRSATYNKGEPLNPNATPEEIQATEKQASSAGTGGDDCPAALAEQFMAQKQEIEKTIALWAGPGDYLPDGTLKPGVLAHFMANTHCEETVKAFFRQCGISDPDFQFSGKTDEKGMMFVNWTDEEGKKRGGANTAPWVQLAVSTGAWVSGESSEMPQRGDGVYAWTGKWVGETWIDGMSPLAKSLGVTSYKHSFVVLEVNGSTVKSANGGAVGQGVLGGTETWSKRESGGKNSWYTQGYTTRRVEGWASYSRLPKDGAPVTGDAGLGDWKQEGSDDAQKAQEEKAKTDASSTNPSSMGEKFTKAQRQQIAEVRAAINAMKNTPPLRLLVNPKQFSVKGSKIVQDGNWGRNGPITEHWGNDQDKISASGKVAGFFALDANNAVGPGLTRAARHFSKAWANLMSLFLFYKNNGGLYLRDHMSVSPEMKNLSMLGSIYIYYDNILYIGSFDSFNLTEADETPFTAEYNFEFTVRAAFLLDRPDSRYDITYSSSNASRPLVSVTGTPQSGSGPAAANPRQQTLDDYLQGLRDSPSDGPTEDEPGGIGEIQAIEQG
jgi:hypothetical protein